MPRISWERLGIPQEELGIMAGKKDVLACCHQELTSDKQQTVDGWTISLDNYKLRNSCMGVKLLLCN